MNSEQIVQRVLSRNGNKRYPTKTAERGGNKMGRSCYGQDSCKHWHKQEGLSGDCYVTKINCYHTNRNDAATRT